MALADCFEKFDLSLFATMNGNDGVVMALAFCPPLSFDHSTEEHLQTFDVTDEKIPSFEEGCQHEK